MRKVVLSIATLLCISILFTNCENEKYYENEQDTIALNTRGIDAGGVSGLATSLANVIQDEESNRMLLNAIGDDELPLFQLKDVRTGVANLEDIISSAGTSVSALLEENPMVNMFIYFPEEVVVEGSIERVAAVEGDQVFLYDAGGNRTEFRDGDELNQLTLVIKPSESLISINKRTMVGSDGTSYSNVSEIISRVTPLFTTTSVDVYSKGSIEDITNIVALIPEDGWDDFLWCDNGVQDPWEEGVDCGGPFCPPCISDATCNDGIQNGYETGVDCGGPFCEPCETYNGVCGYQADRDVNASKDYLHKFKLADCATYKGIKEFLIEGKYLEFRIDIVFANANGAISSVKKTKTIHKNDVKEGGFLKSCKKTIWYDFSPDIDVIYWDDETYGDAMKYVWSEEDSGVEIKIPITIKSKFKLFGQEFEVSGGIELKFKDKDDLLGEAVVDYCDNTDGSGTMYNTGDVYFFVRQH